MQQASGSEENQNQQALAQQWQQMQEAKLKELKIRQMLKQVLEPNAYERLANIRAVNPETYTQLAELIIYLVQNGQVKNKLSEVQLKQLMEKVFVKKHETTITMQRK